MDACLRRGLLPTPGIDPDSDEHPHNHYDDSDRKYLHVEKPRERTLARYKKTHRGYSFKNGVDQPHDSDPQHSLHHRDDLVDRPVHQSRSHNGRREFLGSDPSYAGKSRLGRGWSARSGAVPFDISLYGRRCWRIKPSRQCIGHEQVEHNRHGGEDEVVPGKGRTR